MNLDKYIRDLLYKYDCVIVPNFGAFLTNHTPAIFNKKSNTILPPSKSISFNSKLDQNDGQLANYISQAKNISFEEALAQIEKSVISIKSKLKNNQLIIFDKIGIISQESGYLQFNADRSTNFLKESYGLTNLNQKNIKRKASAGVRKYLKYAAALFIGIIVSASFINYEINEFNINAYNKAEAVIQDKIQKATFIIESPLPSVKMLIKKRHGNFHVVAGSFKLEENSIKRINQLEALGYEARKIGVNKYGLHQIAYSSYKTREDAYLALNIIRKDDNKAAWMLYKILQ